jgi:hypothetical protein
MEAGFSGSRYPNQDKTRGDTRLVRPMRGFDKFVDPLSRNTLTNQAHHGRYRRTTHRLKFPDVHACTANDNRTGLTHSFILNEIGSIIRISKITRLCRGFKSNQ